MTTTLLYTGNAGPGVNQRLAEIQVLLQLRNPALHIVDVEWLQIAIVLL